MISIIKLTYGVEIIGDVIRLDDTHVVIADPLQINYKQRTDMGPPTVFLHRFNPFSKATEHTIKLDHVLLFSVPMDGLVKYYQATLNTIRDGGDALVDYELTEAAKSFDNETNDIDRAMMEKATFNPSLN